jgi:hypothetical protein
MKKTLILLMLIPVLSFGQDLDSLKQRILSIENEQQNIKLHLRAHSSQFSLGTALLVTGAGMLILDALTETEKENPNSKHTLAYVGAGVLTIGTIIQIDSHKWIGRAGRRKRR